MMPRKPAGSPPRMTRDDFVAEVAYLLDCDVHPHQIAVALDVSYDALGVRLRNAIKHGDPTAAAAAAVVKQRILDATSDQSWRGSDWKPWQAREAC